MKENRQCEEDVAIAKIAERLLMHLRMHAALVLGSVAIAVVLFTNTPSAFSQSATVYVRSSGQSARWSTCCSDPYGSFGCNQTANSRSNIACPLQSVVGSAAGSSAVFRQDGSVLLDCLATTSLESPFGCDFVHGSSSDSFYMDSLTLSLQALDENPAPLPPYTISFFCSAQVAVAPIDPQRDADVGSPFAFANLIFRGIELFSRTVAAYDEESVTSVAFQTSELVVNGTLTVAASVGSSALHESIAPGVCGHRNMYGGAASAKITLHGISAHDAAGYPLVVVAGIPLPDLQHAPVICPLVVTSPADVTVCAAGQATFSTAAIGEEVLTFQWRKDGIAINALANPTAATPTLSLTDVQTSDAGEYDCVVTNTCGVATSEQATLTLASSCCDSVDFNGNGIFPEDQDVIDFFDVLAGAPCPTGTCNDIDFNNNQVFPEDQDIIDFLNTLAGASCP